ncbi:hypothetical protein PAHAL_3G029500 [Panicum hallii]|uniref:Uncharacterized protein n=1 Tax=Panicum hallii TaxID=206008 RepID=A0A2S3H609_9POAL|nr:hypothetical protein PAHAL_3G029500 [Panicum hallii]
MTKVEIAERRATKICQHKPQFLIASMYTAQLQVQHRHNQTESHTSTTPAPRAPSPHALQRPRSRHAPVVLHLGRPLRRPPPRREPPHASQPRHRRRRHLILPHLLRLPPPGRLCQGRRRGLVDALHDAVPGPAAPHQEPEPAAAPGRPRAPARPRRAAEARALAVGEDLPDAGDLGRFGLRDGRLGRAAAAAGLGLLGEDGRRVVVLPPRASALGAELPGEADDGRGRRLEVAGEALRGGAVVVGVVLEEALGVGVLLEGVVAVVDAVDLGPGDVVADAEARGLRRVAGARGGHGNEGGMRTPMAFGWGEELEIAPARWRVARFLRRWCVADSSGLL